MKKTNNILFTLILISLLYLISSCGDSLGINGANYIKSKPGADTLLIDTMIDYKKIVIEKIITNTDTIIKIIHKETEYDNIYATKYDFALIEFFNNFFDYPDSELLISNNIVEAYLDYNPITPELNFSIQIDNSDVADSIYAYKNRSEIINKFKINIKNLSAINDAKISLRDIFDDEKNNISLITINNKGKKRIIEEKNIHGNLQISNRIVKNGQIRSLTINCIIILSPNQEIDIKKYSIQFQLILTFPEF